MTHARSTALVLSVLDTSDLFTLKDLPAIFADRGVCHLFLRQCERASELFNAML
jgi:hypothetical protein